MIKADQEKKLKNSDHCGFIPLPGYQRLAETEMLAVSREFYTNMARRRSVRDFSTEPVPREIIRNCLAAAGTAPSGANLQPWYFVAVSNPDLKHRIRMAAEQEEHAFYKERAPEEWLNTLEHLGTDEHKPFLEHAPWLIAIFARKYERAESGDIRKHYYVTESVGIAAGMLITALHRAGLATLTHTPSPMKFLNEILDRPGNERPFLLVVTGYPAENALVPDIHRKNIAEIAAFL
ncbi:MAG: nitroreductase family protein [FCB group bacterium]|nr:nitroreductase family protein [FCB group bacterium]